VGGTKNRAYASKHKAMRGKRSRGKESALERGITTLARHADVA